MLKQHLEIDIKCFCKLFYPFDKYVLKKVIPRKQRRKCRVCKIRGRNSLYKGTGNCYDIKLVRKEEGKSYWKIPLCDDDATREK